MPPNVSRHSTGKMTNRPLLAHIQGGGLGFFNVRVFSLHDRLKAFLTTTILFCSVPKESVLNLSTVSREGFFFSIPVSVPGKHFRQFRFCFRFLERRLGSDDSDSLFGRYRYVLDTIRTVSRHYVIVLYHVFLACPTIVQYKTRVEVAANPKDLPIQFPAGRAKPHEENPPTK